jgi:RNA methyltransferase, TrmH family
MGEPVIRSRANPLVKRLVRLRERRARQREGVVLVEGARELLRARAAGWPLELLVHCPEVQPPEARGAAAELSSAAASSRRLTPDVFAKVSLREHPDGLLGVMPLPRLTLADLAWPDPGLYLVAAGLEKPGNVGALLRTADAVGCDAVFVTGRGTDLGNPNVVRASLGSLFTRPVLHVDDDELRGALRAREVAVLATSPGAAQDLWSVRLTGNLAVVVGPEHTGLDEAWLAAADAIVRVPMRGHADSLNVATSGAVVLFEALRQRTAVAQIG